jgi:uncharacterized protein (DUF305 family)
MVLLKTGFRPRSRMATLAAAVAALILVFAPAAQATGPRPFDRAFMTEMVSHHAMAVDMAEMALDKATHAELRETASDIVRTQTAEIREMRRWLRRWYGATVKPHMTDQDTRDMMELEDAGGGEFELRFMMLMTVHHTFAIERASIARRRARHRAVRRLAKAIVRAQNREIVQFRNWAVAWYAG